MATELLDIIIERLGDKPFRYSARYSAREGSVEVVFARDARELKGRVRVVRCAATMRDEFVSALEIAVSTVEDALDREDATAGLERKDGDAAAD